MESSSLSFMTVKLILFASISFNFSFGTNPQVFYRCMDSMKMYCQDAIPEINDCAKKLIITYQLGDTVPEYIHTYVNEHIKPNLRAIDGIISSPVNFCDNHEELFAPTHFQSYHLQIITELTKEVTDEKSLRDACIEDLSDFPEETDEIIHHALFNKVLDAEKKESFTDLYLQYISMNVHIDVNFLEENGELDMRLWPEHFCVWHCRKPEYNLP